jgi:hypothetical protein
VVHHRAKEIGRKDFLRHVAFGTAAFAGLGGILQVGLLRELNSRSEPNSGGRLDSRGVQTVTPLTGAAIRAAMDRFGGKPGAVALQPGATYEQRSIADQLVIPSNMTFFMNGATLKMTNGTKGMGGAQIVNSDVTGGNTNIAIVGPGVIDGGNAGRSVVTPQGALLMHRIKHLTIENLEIKDAFEGIRLYADALPGYRYMTLSNLDIHHCDKVGLQVSNACRAVNYRNIRVHDCGGEDASWVEATPPPAVIIDASEGYVDGLYAYGNDGTGIFIRNLFACVFNNLVANLNGGHGIYVLALNDSVGSDWLALHNSEGHLNAYSDIYFAGEGAPKFYGTTGGVTITGIRCGKVVGNAGLAAWKNQPDHPDGYGYEAYAIYFEDLIGSFGGDVQLLGVQASPGVTGTFRFPASMGNLIVSTGR